MRGASGHTLPVEAASRCVSIRVVLPGRGCSERGSPRWFGFRFTVFGLHRLHCFPCVPISVSVGIGTGMSVISMSVCVYSAMGVSMCRCVLCV